MKMRQLLMIILCVTLTTVIAGCGKSGEKAAGLQTIGQRTPSADEVKGEAPTQEEDTRHGMYDSAQERLATMIKVAEDEGKELYFDNSYAEIAVLDKRTKEVWFSTPYDYKKDFNSMDTLTVGDDVKSKLASLLKITYYDAKMKVLSMNSYSDCAAKKEPQFTMQPIQNGIRINLQMGLVRTQMVLPEAAEAARFEERVISQLGDKDARKINAYYEKISLNDPKLMEAVKKDYQKNYPGLAEHDFYILRRVSDRERRMIEEIVKKTGYSMEDYLEDQSLSGYVSEEGATALFYIPVEVTLDQGDLVMKIPADEITYDKESFVLSSITLGEFFGAGNTMNDGCLFLPDGSGTLIKYNTDKSKSILYTTNTVYGEDYALTNQWAYTSLKQQLYFPVFGNMENRKAFLAILEEGDAMAKIYSESGNQLTYFETVFPEFNYATTYTVNYQDETKMRGMYTYYDRNYYQGNYKVRYRFLTGEEAGYVGMAKAYQNYLVQKGDLKKQEKIKDNTPLYLEALGTIDKKDTFLGFSVDKAVTLTSFSQAQSILKELGQEEIDNINLRYKGWMNGGLNYTVTDKARAEKNLGGKKGLVKLSEFMKDNQYGFYPDADFYMVRDNKRFDSYIPSWDSPRTLSREEAYMLPPEEASNMTYLMFVFYAVSPNKFSENMKDFFTDYNKLKTEGVSLGNMGTMLYADYKKTAAINRQQVQETITKNLDSYVLGKKKLMTDGGNAYLLKYSPDLVNVPLTDSGYTLSDESIPFMQLVLHGYLSYAGNPLNSSGNGEDAFLKSIEYGSNLFYDIAYENTKELKQTPYSIYYSVDYDNWKKTIADQYKTYNEIYRNLQDKSMTDHRRLSDKVYQTTYEDGTRIIVNYNDTAVTVDGAKVEAKGFAVLH